MPRLVLVPPHRRHAGPDDPVCAPLRPPSPDQGGSYVCVSRVRAPVAIHANRVVVEWADLPIIDFSNASTPEGRAALTPQVCNAMRTSGFMYIVNHGLTQAEVREVVPGHDATTEY